MKILVNNQPAVLKKGSSFDYVSENRLFSGSDGYTLSITFPLKDCPENLAIFGHINRADVTAGNVAFDCEIRHKRFVKYGCITLTNITDREVKAQFLDGRSVQNFNETFDDIYINELTLGYPSTRKAAAITPANAWSPSSPPVAVALPWVIQDSASIINKVNYSDGTYSWACVDICWQPYLIYLTKKICQAIGYSCDLSAWENNQRMKYLLVCNAIPGEWEIYDFARALPHWTVEEYFEKLELLLGCEFDFDHKARTINFGFSTEILQAIEPVAISTVIDTFESEVLTDDPDCTYVEARNIGYKESDNSVWKYYDCNWFVRDWSGSRVEYDTLTELLNENNSLKTWVASSSGTVRPGGTSVVNNRNALLYARDVDTYFVVRTVEHSLYSTNPTSGTNVYSYTCVLQPVNNFGARIVDEENDDEIDEIEFVPVPIDYTEAQYGMAMYLPLSDYSEDNNDTSSYGSTLQENSDRWRNTATVNSLNNGKKEKKNEYYDRIYLAYWHGVNASPGLLPTPYVDKYLVWEDWLGYSTFNFSLRLKGEGGVGLSEPIYSIDPTRKTTFKFLADTLPDVRALFIIRGKRYICEKLTATFTAEQGMSQLIKGVFYPVRDS